MYSISVGSTVYCVSHGDTPSDIYLLTECHVLDVRGDMLVVDGIFIDGPHREPVGVDTVSVSTVFATREEALRNYGEKVLAWVDREVAEVQSEVVHWQDRLDRLSTRREQYVQEFAQYFS